MKKEEEILEEMKEFVKNNKMTLKRLKRHIRSEGLYDWDDVFEKHEDVFWDLCLNPYEFAKERNEEFYGWCRANNYSIFEGLDNIPKGKEYWETIIESPKSLNMLIKWEEIDRRNEQAKRSKAVRAGIPNTRKAKPVRCLDDGKEFKSINQCAAYYGIKRTHDVSDCCYGVLISVYGHHFEFIN